MPAVEIRDLTVEYDAAGYVVRPLDGFCLEASLGNLVLLLGPSGCGKTTLLSCMAGLLTPAAGSICIEVGGSGVDVTRLRPSELNAFRRRTVGIAFQGFSLIPSLTALENVAAPLWTAGWHRRQAHDRASELLDLVGLGERVHHRPDQLSGGQQQRVAIARALALDPPVILADEPTAHLDHVQVEEVIRLLRSLASEKRVVVVATHDERLVPLADQLVALVPAAVEDTGAPVSVALAKGEVLFREGDPSDRIYVVESGSVVLSRSLTDGTTEELAIVGRGGHFGEMGPLFSLRRSATAIARSRTRLTGYTVRQFRELVGVDNLPELVRGLSGGDGGRPPRRTPRSRKG